MASSFPLHSTTATSSQLVGSLARDIPDIPPISSTPGLTATSGFRPSIPPKNSRVPAGDIDKLSLSKMHNQINGKSTPVNTSISVTGDTQSPPPPPIRGINNAQARTARKSAPSSSNRGDGYSTSSSSGGGKKSASSVAKNYGEKRERAFPSLNEEASLSDNDTPTEGPCSPQQTPLTSSPKSQLRQESPEDGQQIGVTSPVVPTPPSPPVQIAGTKRPVSPVTPNHFSIKPKRQKIATAKATALANELGMNADSSAAKKRKQRKNIPEKGSKGKEKINGAGMSPAIMGDCGSGETNSVQPHLPISPPPCQVPANFQKQNTEQGQQAKKDSPMSIKLLAPDSKTPATPSTGLQADCVASAPQTQWQSNDDVIITSITQHTAASKLERRTQNASNKKLMLRNDEWGRNQNTPITIDDGSSDGEGSPGHARSPSGSRGILDSVVRNYALLPGFTQVSDEFFTKCIDTSLSDAERVKLVVQIQKFIVVLAAEARKHPRITKAPLETRRYLPRNQDNSTLGKITALLKYMCVLTNEGDIFTLDEWKGSGMPKFQGRFILHDYQEFWRETRNLKRSGSGTGLDEELRPPKKLNDGTTDVDMTDVADQQTVSPVGACTAPQDTADINIDTMLSGKTKETSANDKLKENLAQVNGSLQSMGTASSPLNLLIYPPRATPAKNPMPPSSQTPPSQTPPSPSNQIQAEASAPNVNFMPTSEIFTAAEPKKLSSKGKGRFGTISVQEFLNEELPRSSSFNTKQERNDQLLTRIVELHQEELHVRDDIDALVVKSRLEEARFGRRIAEAGICAKARVNGGELNSGFGITNDLANSPVDWEEFRKVTKELRDFQDDARKAELRLTDKATRIAEEKTYLIQRRKRMTQTESEPVTTPSFTTSEERSSGNEGSTAPSSVSGSSAPGQGIPPPVKAIAHPEMSAGHELLRGLIPWATQCQETLAESTSPVFTGTEPNQTKPKRKPPRKRKRW